MRLLFPGLSVVAGSLLFATDAYFRERALTVLDARAVGVLEHGIAFLCVLPFVLPRLFGRGRQGESKPLERKDYLLFLALGLGGSAIGNTLFTLGVEKIGGSGATLFTMLQPIFVLALAWLFLKERFSSFFVPCAIWIVANMILLSYTQGSNDSGGIFGNLDENPEALTGMVCAIAATILFAVSTVAGKAAVDRHPNSVVLFWRWGFAFLFLTAVVFVRDVPLPWNRILTREVLLPLFYLGVVSQTAAFWIYYMGLRRLPASLTTFIEVLYPLVGIFIPILAKGEALTALQGFAAMTVLIALSLLLGVEYPKAVASEEEKLPRSDKKRLSR